MEVGVRRRATLTLAIALGGLVVLGLGRSVAAARSTVGEVTIRVPGALTIAVYCGGEDTVHVWGDVVRIEPTERRCYIEAPWSPAMPLRGEFDLVNASATVECVRDNMRLVCR